MTAATDFRPLADLPAALHVRPYRHGVCVIAIRSSGIPEAYLQAILDWRFEQYQATGFYEVDRSESGEDVKSVKDDDIHALALDEEGHLVAYVIAKRPGNGTDLNKWMFRDRDRPYYPAEEVHGRAWQRSVMGVDEIPLNCTWELGRFVSDRARAKTPVAIRAVLELGLIGAWLLYHPVLGKGVELVIGDVDPNVALKNLQMFYIPTAAFPAHQVTNQADTPLAARYRDAQTAPVLFAKRDLKSTTHARWHDIDMALSQPDEQALPRLMTLRTFRYVGESSLRRPLPPSRDIGVPIDALVVPDAHEAGLVMCRAAARGLPGWTVGMLSPGDILPVGSFIWVVDGFAATRVMEGPRVEHLSTAGPDVALTVPAGGVATGPMVTMAATPMRVLISDSTTGEAFLQARKSGFDAPPEVLYGAD